MKLCTCNNCGNIYEDMNPQSDAKEYVNIAGIKPLVNSQREQEDDRYADYWVCPICHTDSFLSDTVDAEKVGKIEEGVTWVCTDPDTNQYGRRLSTYKYEFKEDDKKPTIIDLEKYTWEEICNCCEGYYPNMDELFSTYGAQSTWIIAECCFEMDVIKS
jgi:rubredoxin